ncbi:stage III sporulation protein AE [Clostridium sp. 19966]|uniref:stage III sporulation protein AE n=1 Tax=Clostridium sp. 19966 TaxID=2768166 RepID=UPI0028DD65E6|nr:stage III sporulation protein AE [Clostridium sp. 19966]MDT8716585.1 stage III sporulation protein AE [Clostridium sp. 19966]
MKRYIVIFVLIMIFCVPLRVCADTNNAGLNSNEQAKVDSLYDYINNMKDKLDGLNDLDINQYVNNYISSGKSDISMNKIYGVAIKYIFKELLASAKLMVSVVVIAILAALINNLQSAFSNDKLANIAFYACYSVLILVISKSFLLGIDLAKTTINGMVDFMMSLIPVLIMLIAGSGGVSEATVMDPIIVTGINVAARIYVTVIIPLILAGFILQFVNNISDEYKVDKLSKLVNQFALWAQGILMTIFIGVITIRGITSNTMDVVTTKTAKFAVDNFIPVVGKCLSDAISTVAGYSLLLKNALSTLGLIIIVIAMALPIIKIFIMAMLYRFTAAMVEPISDKRIVNCITCAGESLILIMSCLISVTVMFFIMISILASSGKVLVGS